MPWQQKDFLALLALAAFFIPVHVAFDVLQYWPVWYFFAVTTFNYVSVHPAISTFVEAFFSLNKWTQTFIFLFLFRYTRLMVNTVSFLTYKATPIATFPKGPILLAKDVTVIIPTVEPSGEDFENCIYSIARNNPAKIMVITAGPGKDVEAKRVCNTTGDPPIFEVLHCKVPNKRTQVCKALQEVWFFKASTRSPTPSPESY